MKRLFITGTDTDAGKTFFCAALARALVLQKQNVAAFKPISAGCEIEGNQLINGDAKLLSQVTNCNQSISNINPVTFKDPIAPHIAAAKLNQPIHLADIQKSFSSVTSLPADFVLVEGAGGWRLPLGHSNNKTEFLSSFVQLEKLDVILVVNMKLGCLNHALLTYDAIKADGLNCIAWIANNASEEVMSNHLENIAELEVLLPIPKIAQFEFFNNKSLSTLEKVTQAALQINLSDIL